MHRFIALDIGAKRTGVALADDQSRVGTPLETISENPKSKEFNRRLFDLVCEWEPKSIIVGLPIDLKGKESKAALDMRDLVETISAALNSSLQKAGQQEIEFRFIDERLTTAQAEKSLISANLSSDSRKRHRDALAAALIAQSWVDTL